MISLATRFASLLTRMCFKQCPQSGSIMSTTRPSLLSLSLSCLAVKMKLILFKVKRDNPRLRRCAVRVSLCTAT